MRINRFLLCALLCPAIIVGTSEGELRLVAPVAAANVVTVSDTDNGRTIEVARGTRIELILHSTYWQDIATSDASVVVPEGEPRAEGNLKDCMPGAGCGTITQVFTAAAAGTARLSADRKVCGEVRPCPPDERHFEVMIVIRSRG